MKKRPNDALNQHCEYTEIRSIPHPQSKNKTIDSVVIPEPDIYSLIFGSKLKSAKKFKMWVFGEVLPSIRKTGSYSIQSELEQENTILRLELQKDDIERKQMSVFMASGQYGEVSKITNKERCIPVKGYYRTGKPKNKNVSEVLQMFFEFTDPTEL